MTVTMPTAQHDQSKFSQIHVPQTNPYVVKLNLIFFVTKYKNEFLVNRSAVVIISDNVSYHDSVFRRNGILKSNLSHAY